MENTNYRFEIQTAGADRLRGYDPDDEAAERRLARLTALNTEFELGERAHGNFRTLPAQNGVGFESTFAFLGLCLGLLPPAAFFLNVLLYEGDLPILIVGLLVTLFASLTGYLSGRLVGRTVKKIERLSWPVMMAALPFIGLVWGIVAGAAGGVFAFIIGAIPGAVIGGAVGLLALPVFGSLDRLLRNGDEIERKHLLPIALGVSGIIAASFLGMSA